LFFFLFFFNHQSSSSVEMCDNHVEYHTVKEFVAFCCDGPGGAAAGNMWSSQFPGKA
jgi:hypothetical protein